MQVSTFPTANAAWASSGTRYKDSL
jgi:hypothetical protein